MKKAADKRRLALLSSSTSALLVHRKLWIGVLFYICNCNCNDGPCSLSIQSKTRSKMQENPQGHNLLISTQKFAYHKPVEGNQLRDSCILMDEQYLQYCFSAVSITTLSTTIQLPRFKERFVFPNTVKVRPIMNACIGPHIAHILGKSFYPWCVCQVTGTFPNDPIYLDLWDSLKIFSCREYAG